MVCISTFLQRSWSLMQIDMQDLPDGKHKKMEKYILRKAFDDPSDPYLPESVLWRQKEQFSDGVGYSWVDGLKEYAQQVCIAAKLQPQCVYMPGPAAFISMTND